MTDIAAPTQVKWNEIAKVGLPPEALRSYSVGSNAVPRTFLCRGEWSMFTSRMHGDGSGFEDEADDTVQAWAVIDGF